MKNHLRLAAIAALAAASFAGCRTSVNSIDPANPEGKPTPVSLSNTTTDESLAGAIVPVFYNKGQTPAGFLAVQLQVQNQTRTMARVSYSVEWFDTNGMLITSAAGKQWRALTVEAGKVETIQAIAPQANAADAKFHFIESKN